MRIGSLAILAMVALAGGDVGEATAFTTSLAESKDKTRAYVRPSKHKMSAYGAEIHRLIFTEIKRTALPFALASGFTFLVRFDLDRQGRLVGLTLLQGSNLPEANDYALQIIRRASRGFPPPPASLPGERVAFAIPIRMIME